MDKIGDQILPKDINVKAIPDLPNDFIKGMDLSSLIAEEESGVKFYDFDGKEADPIKTFKEGGINYIRLRIWNDPYDGNGNGYGGGNSDLDKAIKLGKRATANGLKVNIDFHYSDFWADWMKQLVPKAWKNMSYEEKTHALYQFTKDSLVQLLEEGVDVSMVQVGNEINIGVAGESETDKVIGLLKEGCRAVREVSACYHKDIKILIHYTRIPAFEELDNLVKGLEDNDLDYDLIGLSYYPFWDKSFEVMEKAVSHIRNTYGKPVVLAEISYAFTTVDGDEVNNCFNERNVVPGYPASVQGQADMIRDIVDRCLKAGGSGVFYWEGAWIPVSSKGPKFNSSIWEKYGSGWASSYANSYDKEHVGEYYGGSSWDNQTFFDFEGCPLASINVWKYLKEGHKAD